MVFDISRFGLSPETLPKGWRIDRLDNLAYFNPTQIDKNYPHTDIEYLDISGVNKGSINGIENLILKEAPSRAKRIVAENDTIISTVRPGNRAFVFLKNVPPNRIVSTGFSVLRAKNDNSPRFIYYLSTSDPIIDYLASIAEEKTAYPSINPEDIAECEVPIPPVTEQKNIAHILGTLDDKIELNRKMNETLEAIAQALFKSWFVDFDPVYAKTEGRDTGLPKEIADLFPSEFQDSKLGKVPKDWHWSPLLEVSEINPLRRTEKGVVAPYVEMANVKTVGHRPEGWFLRAVGSGTRFKNGDTLLARITPCLENGKTAFVDFLDEGVVGWGSTEYIVIRPLPPIPSEWGYLLARDEVFRDFAIQKMNGTTGRQRVSAETIGHYMIVRASKEIYGEFGKIIKLLFQKMSINHDENKVLSDLRDVLLQKLISGELKVG